MIVNQGEILKIERNEDGTFKIAQLEDSSKKFAHPTTGMIMDNDSGKVSGSTSPNIVTGYEIKKYTSATDGVQSGDGQQCQLVSLVWQNLLLR